VKKIVSLAAATAVALTGLAVSTPNVAHAASCEPRSEIVSGKMNAAIVLGPTAPKNSTFTMVVTSCFDYVLASASFYRSSTYGFDYADMEEVAHSGNTYTFKGTTRWDPRDLYNTQAGTWLSESTVYSETNDEEYTSNFYVQRYAYLTTNATPEPVMKGKTLTITGSLKRANWETRAYTGYGAQTVALQYRSKNSTVYKNVKTVKTDSKGTLRTTVKAGADGYYRYQYTANPTSTSEATSVGDFVDVR
jgi:hypothetical protein